MLKPWFFNPEPAMIGTTLDPSNKHTNGERAAYSIRSVFGTKTGSISILENMSLIELNHTRLSVPFVVSVDCLLQVFYRK